MRLTHDSAHSDEAGQAIRFEAGHLFRREAGRASDLKPATLGVVGQVWLDDGSGPDRGSSGALRRFRCFLLSHALSLEFDPICVVDEAVERSIGNGWVTDDLLPAIHWELVGDHDRAPVISIFDDFQKIAALLGSQSLWPPVIEDQ